MKRTTICSCLLFLVLFLCSCGNDNDKSGTGQQPEQTGIRTHLLISVTFPSDQCQRVQSPSGIHSTEDFQEGDALLVVDLSNGYCGKMIYNPTSSCFEGDALLNMEDELSVVYPYPDEYVEKGRIRLFALPQDGKAPHPYYWGFTKLDMVNEDTYLSLRIYNLCNTCTVNIVDENEQPIALRSVSLSALKGKLYASRMLNLRTGNWEDGVDAQNVDIANESGIADGKLVLSLIPTSALIHAVITDNKGNTFEGEAVQTTFKENAEESLTICCITPAESKDYIIVCGTKWAKGNLQYISDEEGAEGFQPNWRLAPTQYHYFNPVYGTQGTYLSVDLPYDTEHVDLFNWGACGKNALDITQYGTRSCTDIAAKMYTNKYLSLETDDFDAALFGDIVYWATRGRWRMPRLEELYALYAEASYSFGYVQTPEGNLVFGFLFTTPVGERITDTTVHYYSKADLDNGLFLPGAGFRQQKTAAIKRAGKCGFYWDSYQPENANRMCLRFIDTTLFWSGDGALYGRSIRPVLNE